MSFFWMVVLAEGGLAIIAILADVFLLGLNYWQQIWCHDETLGQIFWGLLPLIIGYFVLQALPLESLQRIDRLVREMFQQHMNSLKLWQLAVIAALAGIGEELFFRGLLQLGLSSVFHVWLAIFLASLLFGMAHAVTRTYFLLAFVISVYLGFLFDYTGNLFVPIAIHALYDFFVFLYIKFTSNSDRQELRQNSEPQSYNYEQNPPCM